LDHYSDYFVPYFHFPALINTQATTILVFVLLILIIILFCVAGAEVAFFALTFKEINLLKTKQQPGYKRIVLLLVKPKLLLASLVTGKIFINLAIVLLAHNIIGEIVTQDNQLWYIQLLVKALSISFIIILFGEIMPKVLARQNSIRFAKDVGPLIQGVYFLFNGLGERMISTSTYFEEKLTRTNAHQYNIADLDLALGESLDTEATTKEKNILRSIARFGNISVRQIMKSRIDVSGVAIETRFADLVAKIEELHYSRLPVFKDDLDEVVGMINTKDILPYLDQTADFNWHFLMRPPYFVHEQKMIDDLLKEFQSKRIHFAVVVDEFGGTSGIVTLEDIIEEVIGDINDEFDEIDMPYTRVDDYNFIFDGKTLISEVYNALNLDETTFDLVKGESETLAGLVLELAGVIPLVNEVFTYERFDLTVLEIEKNRLQKVKVTVNPVIN